MSNNLPENYKAIVDQILDKHHIRERFSGFDCEAAQNEIIQKLNLGSCQIIREVETPDLIDVYIKTKCKVEFLELNFITSK